MSEAGGMVENHDCGGDAAAYVLGALDPAEAREFRRHLEQCAICRDEVAALRGVALALPMAAPQHPVPRRLRRRVMRAVGQEPRRPAAAGRPPRTLVRSRPALAAAASAVVVCLGVLAAVVLSSGSGSVREIRAQVAGISGTAEVRVAGGHGALVVRRLSPPPPGHVYEVWLKAPGRPPVPANVLFDVSGAGSAQVRLPVSLQGISQLMVTPEPAGGTPVPTHAPVIVAQLS